MNKNDIKKEVKIIYPLAVSRRIKLPSLRFYEIFDFKSMQRIGRGKSEKDAWENADRLNTLK